MKTAEITYEDSKNGTLHIDGEKIGELINNATMDDMGGSYFAHVETETEHGTIRIVWETTEAWDNEEANMEDESTACDWDKFVVLDESGDQIAEAND